MNQIQRLFLSCQISLDIVAVAPDWQYLVAALTSFGSKTCLEIGGNSDADLGTASFLNLNKSDKIH